MGVFSFLRAEESTDYIDEPVSFDEDVSSLPKQFWSFEADYDWISKAKFTTPEERGNSIRFSEGTIELAYARMLNRCEGIAIGAGYDGICIDWKNNGFFCEDDFSKVLVKVYGFSARLPCWEWKGGVTGRFDTSHFDLYDHTVWDILLWGRYSWSTRYFKDVGLNIGFLSKVGIDKQWALPIIGIDFVICPKWKINLVFPTDLSVHYLFNDRWSLVLTNRFWNVRSRLKKSEPLSEGIFEYRNSGLDLGVCYHLCEYIHGEIHAGSTYGSGDMKISDKDNHTIRHNKFKSSAYVGMSADFKF